MKIEIQLRTNMKFIQIVPNKIQNSQPDSSSSEIVRRRKKHTYKTFF